MGVFDFVCAMLLIVGGTTTDISGPRRLAVIQRAPDLSLITDGGKLVTSGDFKGKVLLVGFIFTTCNGSCPATTHRMSQVQQELKNRRLDEDKRVQFLSITLDPAKDSPDVLKRYMRLYDLDSTNWNFLTGPPEQVAKTIDAWGMWARPAANGQLDHPSRIYLVDSLGRIREIYNLGFMKPAWVAEDIALLLQEGSKCKN